MSVIRQSTARTILVGPVLDADGAAKTDEVVANIRVTKNGTVGSAHGSTTLTHDHAGKYKLAMNAGDSDTVGVLEISLTSGTNDMPVRAINVVEEAVFDAMYAASAVGPNTVTPDASGVAAGLHVTTDALIDRNADLGESRRGFHTWQGNTFYVDPINGGTHANGNRGGKSDPYLTLQDCHDNAVTDSNHDVVIMVAGAAAGVTTHSIAGTTTISKRYVFIRGPGRDFIFTRTGNGDTIAITADGIEVSGMQIGTAATGAGHGIKVTDADFHRIHRCWFLDTQGDGIQLLRSSNTQIHDNHFEGTGVGGSGQGIHLVGTAGSSNDNVIYNNHFAATGGDSILLEQGTTNDTEIFGNTIHNAGGWGVNVGASSTDAQVHHNMLGNNVSGNIQDNGTTSIIQNNEDIPSLVTSSHTTTDALIDALPTIADVANSAGSSGADNEPAIASPGGFFLIEFKGAGEVNNEDATNDKGMIDHRISDESGSLDCFYLANIGTTFQPVGFTWLGRVAPSGEAVTVYVNTGTIASPVWREIDFIFGTDATENVPHSIKLYESDEMTGADAGKVAIRFEGSTAGFLTLRTDQFSVQKTNRAAILTNQTAITDHLTDIKGTGFVKDTDSLVDLAHTGADSDTLETLSDQIDTLSALSGDGAFTGVLTINDGATGLQGATVNARLGGVLKATGTTGILGKITTWAFGANTYDVTVVLDGYEPTTETLTVTANGWTKTISLTLLPAITPPPNAATTTGVMTVYDEEGSVESGVSINVNIIKGPGTDGIGYDTAVWTEVSSVLGIVQFAGIILGARYQIWRGESRADVQTFTAPTTGTSFDLAEVIGRG